MNWLTNLSWQQIALAAGLFLITFAGSLALVSFLLVKMPADYFHSTHERTFLPDRSRAVRLAGIILKNIAGLLLVALGVLMSLPGVPGQGLLTILLGLVLLDFPGKHRVEQNLVRRPLVLNAINGLRAKFAKPPLLLD